jgi:pentatricopeptide repeat domain-containing protein 1
LITSNSLISACQKSSLWPVALHHLHEAAAASIAPDTLSFNAAISACRRTWRLALQYLKLMKICGTQWSNISYNSGISSELQWLRSLGMMESMRATQVQTSRVTYNAILDAMERGSMWQSGAAMFATLGTIQPDVVTYASSINSYVQVDAWAAVLELLTSMGSSRCTANTVTTTSAICACTERSEHRWPLATSLFRRLLAGNLRPNELSSSSLLATMEVWWQSLGSLTWMHQLGINGLPFNAAAAGCALQYQWPRCLHLASMENSLDVVSSNALAAVCHRIHHPHLAATLMGPLQMAALKTLSRHKKRQSMNSR